MARIYSVKAPDPITGLDRVFWCAESAGTVIASGDTADEAAQAAYDKLIGCADIARANHLPTRYVRRLVDEANVFRPGPHFRPPGV